MSDNYKSDCRFSELAISYLYGEIDSRDRAAFESHFVDCPACAHEIKGYDLVRGSIGNWKKNEFDRLPTPKIEFLPEQPVKTAASLKERITASGEMFVSFKAAAAGAAFVLLLMSVILLSRMFSGGSEIANLQSENLRKTERTSIVVDVENARAAKNVTGDETAVPAVEKKTPTVSGDRNSLEKETKLKSTDNQFAADAPKSAVIYTKSDNIATAGKNLSKQTYPAAVKNPGAAAALTRKPKSLKLNSPDEETEEVSPRLTDLFDAVGEK